MMVMLKFNLVLTIIKNIITPEMILKSCSDQISSKAHGPKRKRTKQRKKNIRGNSAKKP